MWPFWKQLSPFILLLLFRSYVNCICSQLQQLLANASYSYEFSQTLSISKLLHWQSICTLYMVTIINYTVFYSALSALKCITLQTNTTTVTNTASTPRTILSLYCIIWYCGLYFTETSVTGGNNTLKPSTQLSSCYQSFHTIPDPLQAIYKV